MASDKPPRKTAAEFFADLYDKWAIPVSDEPGAPLVTSLHDGADWVQVHAPRAFFEELAAKLEEGDTDDLHKWLHVWAMPRKEPNPDLCGAPTRQGSPCHYDKPCRHHGGGGGQEVREQRRRFR